MFGINKKRYFIISGVLFVIAIIVLILSLTNIISQDRLIILSIIAICLLSLCILIQPYNKKLRIVNEYIKKYRPVLYNELGFFEHDFNKIIVKENDNGLLYIDFNKRLLFDDLTKEEAEYIMLKLIKDFVIINYSVYENNKLNLNKLSIEQFSVIFEYKDNTKKEVKIVEGYEIKK